MAHAVNDPVLRSVTDDGTSGNDVKLISFADEEPVTGLIAPIVMAPPRPATWNTW